MIVIEDVQLTPKRVPVGGNYLLRVLAHYIQDGGDDVTLTRYRYPLSWHYETRTNPDGSFLGRSMWATIGGTPPADLKDRAIVMSVSGIDGGIDLALPVFAVSIPGDDFLIAAETLYNVDKDLFESNFSFMFSHLVVILASEIKEG